jgi:hypothetical protein
MDFLFYEVISKPLWLWLMFLTIVVALMIFDLGVLHKEDHEIGVAESLKLSAFYILISIAFGGYIWWAWANGTLVTSDGTNPVASYFQGYIIEKLSGQKPRGYVAPWWEMSASTAARRLPGALRGIRLRPHAKNAEK